MLGPRFEENFRRSLLISRGDLTTFIDRPITAFFLFICVVLMVGQFYVWLRKPENSYENTGTDIALFGTGGVARDFPDLSRQSSLSIGRPSLSSLRIKRVDERPSPDDGVRILVDRLWPRGLRKDAAVLTIGARTSHHRPNCENGSTTARTASTSSNSDTALS